MFSSFFTMSEQEHQEWHHTSKTGERALHKRIRAIVDNFRRGSAPVPPASPLKGLAITAEPCLGYQRKNFSPKSSWVESIESEPSWRPADFLAPQGEGTLPPNTGPPTPRLRGRQARPAFKSVPRSRNAALHACNALGVADHIGRLRSL